MGQSQQDSVYFLLSVYNTLLGIVSLVALIVFRKLDKPAKLMASLVFLSFAVEFTTFLSYKYLGKWPYVLHHIYNPIQFSIICLYYHHILEPFRKKRIAWLLIPAAIAISVINSLFIQKSTAVQPTYFLNLEAILIIPMTLYHFYVYANEDDYDGPIFNFRFLISCILLVFWSFTFVYWLVGLQLNIKDLWYMLLCIAMITYGAMGIVFIFYDKLKLK